MRVWPDRWTEEQAQEKRTSEQPDERTTGRAQAPEQHGGKADRHGGVWFIRPPLGGPATGDQERAPEQYDGKANTGGGCAIHPTITRRSGGTNEQATKSRLQGSAAVKPIEVAVCGSSDHQSADRRTCEQADKGISEQALAPERHGGKAG